MEAKRSDLTLLPMYLFTGYHFSEERNNHCVSSILLCSEEQYFEDLGTAQSRIRLGL